MITLGLDPPKEELPITEYVLQDAKGDPLAHLELDFKKLIADLWDKPAVLEAVLRNYVEQVSPLAIILVQAADTRDWAAFEGQVNVRRGTFKVITPIQTFPCNKIDIRKPPTQALNLVASCAAARGLPIWVP